MKGRITIFFFLSCLGEDNITTALKGLLKTPANGGSEMENNEIKIDGTKKNSTKFNQNQNKLKGRLKIKNQKGDFSGSAYQTSDTRNPSDLGADHCLRFPLPSPLTKKERRGSGRWWE